MPKIIAVSGYKNSGKTTLITRLITRLSEEGIRIATIKHDGHDFEADREGTDTYKHLQAGAVGTAIFSEHKYMIVNHVKTTEELLIESFSQVDLILLEGFKSSEYPKIELVKAGESSVCNQVLAVVLENKISSVIDDDDSNTVSNVYDRDDIEGISSLVLSFIGEES